MGWKRARSLRLGERDEITQFKRYMIFTLIPDKNQYRIPINYSFQSAGEVSCPSTARLIQSKP
jgi:hypothetical protein